MKPVRPHEIFTWRQVIKAGACTPVFCCGLQLYQFGTGMYRHMTYCNFLCISYLIMFHSIIEIR